ncbi:MAG: multiheme c-type cytochrome [Bryobacteraceae bacterium]
MLWFLLFVVPSFVGPEACRECHSAQFRKQSASNHATALRPAAQTPLAEWLGSVPLRERSGVEFAYAPSDSGVMVTITKGKDRLEALIEWAFGSGVQAITPVGRFRGSYFEHRISWYTEPGHPARTIGHPGEPSRSPERALGQMQNLETITRCFGCHATAVKDGPDISAMLPGVTCERCHGPASDHVRGPSRENIVSHSGRSAAASIQLCAECHRGPEGSKLSPQPERDDPVSIRFQPVGLLASKCYKASETLSCVTCHDPHENLVRDSSHYVARCLSCHAESTRTGSRCGREQNRDCLPCHMQRSSPLPFLTFTDHRIRVYSMMPATFPPPQ